MFFHLKKIKTLFALLAILVFGHSVHGQMGHPDSQRSAQPTVRIELEMGTLRCPANIVCLKHIARISSAAHQSNLTKTIGAIDLDSFSDPNTEVRISKQQVKIRLMLAGIEEHQYTISGPEQLVVFQSAESQVLHKVVESRLQQLLSRYYQIPFQDLSITTDPRRLGAIPKNANFDSLQLGPSQPIELKPGVQSFDVILYDANDQEIATRLPATVGIVRELVVAQKFIARGETLNENNIATVRRPVSDRNVRLASFAQALGQQVQSDIQPYELIKPNSIRTVSRTSNSVVKRNSTVRLILEHGNMKLVLKNAKALENGQVGDYINLINPTTNREVQGRVVDASTVLIKY